MTTRAVVFDLDGTLLDTLADIANTGNQVLEEAGFPIHSVSDYRRFVGDGVRVLVERILPPDQRTAERIDRGSARFAEIYHHRWNEATQPYAGIRSLLGELATRRMPMCVLSNKPQAFTDLCVKHLLGEWDFAIVFGQREGVPRKPDPTAALEIAARLGVAPGECAYVGDSSVDMQTATAAGMLAIGVAWGFRSVSELKQHGARHILHHPCDLLDIIDGKQGTASHTG